MQVYIPAELIKQEKDGYIVRVEGTGFSQEFKVGDPIFSLEKEIEKQIIDNPIENDRDQE